MSETTVSVPRFTEKNEVARVLQWHIDLGGFVAKESLLVELETQKAVIEVRADCAGHVLKRCVDEGGTVRPGDALAIIARD